MRVLIVHGNRRFRFLNVESSPRDGSLSLTVRRDGTSQMKYRWLVGPGDPSPKQVEIPKDELRDKRITIHQSGRVNFHELGRHIYLEPLTRLSVAACIYKYRLPRISALSQFDQPPEPEDCEFDLSDLPDEALSFSIYMGPEAVAVQQRGIKLSYLQRYALTVAVDAEPFIPPPEFNEHFVTIKPEFGTVQTQAISEDEALIQYHQALHNSKDVIIYGPNGAGLWNLIFARPMRIPPQLEIELEDPELFVDDNDIVRDSRVAKAMIKFLVRKRSNRQIVKSPVSFRSIALHAEL